MTRTKSNIVIVVVALLAVGILLLFIFRDKTKRYSWWENYRVNSSEPYGTLFIQQLLDKHPANRNFAIRAKDKLTDLLKKEEYSKNATYVFIGEGLYLNTAEEEALFEFIANGNTAFLAVQEIPKFITSLYIDECGAMIDLDGLYLKDISMNFYHPSLKQKYPYSYAYQMGVNFLSYQWAHFPETIFCGETTALTPLGYLDENRVNFLRMKHGQGTIYVHSNPIVFTNYNIVNREKADYAAAALSHVTKENIIWEESAKIPILNQSENQGNNPLYYIMQQPSLKYAWWLLVLAIILYVVFAAKRNQRAIPILERKNNTSWEFVKMVAALHYQNKDHMDMARKKIRYFHYFIRSRYGIHALPYNDQVALRLSEKSKVSIEEVNAVFKFQKLIEEGSNGQIDEIRLNNFYNVVENFYKKCK